MTHPTPRPPSGLQTGGRFGVSVPDRVVFATSKDGKRHVVRYDRQGRWYVEVPVSEHRVRLASVHEAAQTALVMEAEGGKIRSGQPGGKQFDAKVAGGRRRAGRR